ncbi:MAG: hypothetical protein AB1546_12045 [bacterium]
MGIEKSGVSSDKYAEIFAGVFGLFISIKKVSLARAITGILGRGESMDIEGAVSSDADNFAQ